MILPKVRDHRFITVRRGEPSLTRITTPGSMGGLVRRPRLGPLRGGSANGSASTPSDRANRRLGAWQVTMMAARAAGGHAMGAARNLRGAARHAA